MNTATTESPFRRLVIVALAVNVYVQLSELVRYLVVVQPLLQNELSVIDGVARIDAVIFPIWGLWGTVLSGLVVWSYWTTAQTLGPSLRTAVISGTASWLGAFVILWVGVANMQLTSWTIPAVALPLALIEMVTATILARWLLDVRGRRRGLTPITNSPSADPFQPVRNPSTISSPSGLHDHYQRVEVDPGRPTP